jgi:hypothetical protein
MSVCLRARAACLFSVSLCLLAFGAASDATQVNACAPSGWQADTTGLPDCAELSSLDSDTFELANNCADDLVLTHDCPSCAVPSVVDAGDMVLVDLAPQSTQDSVVIDVVGTASSGSLGFTFLVNRCPDGAGCTASARARPTHVALLGSLLGLTLLYRRRRSPGTRMDTQSQARA